MKTTTHKINPKIVPVLKQLIDKRRMKEQILKFNKLKETITEDLKKYVVDKSIPLEERWEMFILSELGSRENSIVHFKGKVEEWLDNDILDGDMTSKYEEVTSSFLVEMAEDDEKDFVSDLKEQILKKFLYSFKFDW